MNAKVRIQVCDAVISWGTDPTRQGGNRANFGVVNGPSANSSLFRSADREKPASLRIVAGQSGRANFGDTARKSPICAGAGAISCLPVTFNVSWFGCKLGCKDLRFGAPAFRKHRRENRLALRYGRLMTADGPVFPPGAFRKMDSEDDAAFYATPRFATHIDDIAIAALSQFYRERLPAGGRILDLMSSWVSHLPPEIVFDEVVGHGMNAEELAANPRLNRFFVQNLNREPKLPLGDATFDVITICVSIQYLERPINVLRECARVLKVGGQIVISFSNRCFPTKAVAIWQASSDKGHARLVEIYLQNSGFADISAHRLVDGLTSDPMIAVTGCKV